MGRGLATFPLVRGSPITFLGGFLGLGATPFFLGMGYTLYDVLRHDTSPIPLVVMMAGAWV